MSTSIDNRAPGTGGNANLVAQSDVFPDVLGPIDDIIIIIRGAGEVIQGINDRYNDPTVPDPFAPEVANPAQSLPRLDVPGLDGSPLFDEVPAAPPPASRNTAPTPTPQPSAPPIPPTPVPTYTPAPSGPSPYTQARLAQAQALAGLASQWLSSIRLDNPRSVGVATDGDIRALANDLAVADLEGTYADEVRELRDLASIVSARINLNSVERYLSGQSPEQYSTGGFQFDTLDTVLSSDPANVSRAAALERDFDAWRNARGFANPQTIGLPPVEVPSHEVDDLPVPQQVALGYGTVAPPDGSILATVISPGEDDEPSRGLGDDVVNPGQDEALNTPQPSDTPGLDPAPAPTNEPGVNEPQFREPPSDVVGPEIDPEPIPDGVEWGSGLDDPSVFAPPTADGEPSRVTRARVTEDGDVEFVEPDGTVQPGDSEEILRGYNPATNREYVINSDGGTSVIEADGNVAYDPDSNRTFIVHTPAEAIPGDPSTNARLVEIARGNNTANNTATLDPDGGQTVNPVSININGIEIPIGITVDRNATPHLFQRGAFALPTIQQVIQSATLSEEEALRRVGNYAFENVPLAGGENKPLSPVVPDRSPVDGQPVQNFVNSVLESDGVRNVLWHAFGIDDIGVNELMVRFQITTPANQRRFAADLDRFARSLADLALQNPADAISPDITANLESDWDQLARTIQSLEGNTTYTELFMRNADTLLRDDRTPFNFLQDTLATIVNGQVGPRLLHSGVLPESITQITQFIPAPNLQEASFMELSISRNANFAIEDETWASGFRPNLVLDTEGRPVLNAPMTLKFNEQVEASLAVNGALLGLPASWLLSAAPEISARQVIYPGGTFSLTDAAGREWTIETGSGGRATFPEGFTLDEATTRDLVRMFMQPAAPFSRAGSMDVSPLLRSYRTVNTGAMFGDMFRLLRGEDPVRTPEGIQRIMPHTGVRPTVDPQTGEPVEVDPNASTIQREQPGMERLTNVRRFDLNAALGGFTLIAVPLGKIEGGLVAKFDVDQMPEWMRQSTLALNGAIDDPDALEGLGSETFALRGGDMIDIAFGENAADMTFDEYLEAHGESVLIPFTQTIVSPDGSEEINAVILRADDPDAASLIELVSGAGDDPEALFEVLTEAEADYVYVPRLDGAGLAADDEFVLPLQGLEQLDALPDDARFRGGIFDPPFTIEDDQSSIDGAQGDFAFADGIEIANLNIGVISDAGFFATERPEGVDGGAGDDGLTALQRAALSPTGAPSALTGPTADFGNAYRAMFAQEYHRLRGAGADHTTAVALADETAGDFAMVAYNRNFVDDYLDGYGAEAHAVRDEIRAGVANGALAPGALNVFYTAIAAGASLSEAQDLAMSAGIVEPAIPGEADGIDLEALTGAIDDAAALAQTVNNPIGGVFLSAARTLVEVAALGDGALVSDEIGTFLRGAGMTFGQLAEALGRGDLAAWGAVVSDLGSTIETLDDRSAAATAGASMNTLGSTLQAVGRGAGNDGLVIAGLAIDGVGNVLTAASGVAPDDGPRPTVAGAAGQAVGSVLSFIGARDGNELLSLAGESLNLGFEAFDAFTAANAAGLTDTEAFELRSGANAAIAQLTGAALERIIGGDAGRVLGATGDVVSTVFRINAGTVAAPVGAVQIAQSLFRVAGVNVPPEANFFANLGATIALNTALGWISFGLGFAFNLFGMGRFTEETVLARGIDADADGALDDTATLEQEYRRGFFGRVRHKDDDILYDVVSPNPAFLDNVSYAFRSQTTPVEIRRDEDKWRTYHYIKLNGEEVRGRFEVREGRFDKDEPPARPSNAIFVTEDGRSFTLSAHDDGRGEKGREWLSAEVPTGNMILDLDLSYRGINPGSRPESTVERRVLNPEQYAAFVAEFAGPDEAGTRAVVRWSDGNGNGEGSIADGPLAGQKGDILRSSREIYDRTGWGVARIGERTMLVRREDAHSDRRPEAFAALAGSIDLTDLDLDARPQLRTILDNSRAEFRGDGNDLYQYIDMNLDGAPDLVRFGLDFDGLKDKSDGMVEVTLLNDDLSPRAASFTVETFEEASEIAALHDTLYTFAASNPWAIDGAPDAAHYYRAARDSGMLDALKALQSARGAFAAALSSGDLGAVERTAAGLTAAERAARLTFRADAYVDANPDVGLWAGGTQTDEGLTGWDPLRATEHFINHGYAERRRVDRDGSMIVADAATRQAVKIDPEAYAALYEDVATHFGADMFGVASHYLLHGIGEGRRPSERALDLADPADALAYGASRRELRDVALGAETPAVVVAQARRHYAFEGFAAGDRIRFDAAAYAQANPDLPFGSDPMALAMHYMQHGVAEGRRASEGDHALTTTARALGYAYSSPDLFAAARAAGTTGEAIAFAREHYAYDGRHEGRALTFDAALYAEANPDVAAAFDGNLNKIARHYLEFGASEGRAPSPDQPSLAASANALSYVFSDRALMAASRDMSADEVLTLARDHYADTGRFEARTLTFDPIAYGAANPDVAAAFGEDRDEMAAHYLAFGIAEGRAIEEDAPSLLSEADALSYLFSAPDLMAQLGNFATPAEAAAFARAHYAYDGRFEGRAVAFDPADYLESNPDVAQAVAGDRDAAARHYFDFGRHEGRAVQPGVPSLAQDASALEYLYSRRDLLAGAVAGSPEEALGVARSHYAQTGRFEPSSPTFSTDDYAAANPDVASHFGGDRDRIAAHYLAHGIAEGRPVAPGAISMSRDADALAYLASYTDLSAEAAALPGIAERVAFAREHFALHGRFEGRSVSFDAAAYAAANPDVADHYGGDLAGSGEHYILFGAAEGRPLREDGPNLTSDAAALAYAFSHADFASDILTLTDEPAALADWSRAHYAQTGRFDGRTITFDVERYAQANPDVAAAHGADADKVAGHYAQFGLAEGRPTAPGAPDLTTTAGALSYVFSNPVLMDAASSLASVDEVLQLARLHFGHHGRFGAGEPISFSVPDYAAANPDVANAYGGDADDIAQHYLLFGWAESRPSA